MKPNQIGIAFILFTLAVLPGTIHAQTSADNTEDRTSEATGPKRFWQANLSGGSYIVALDRITSISKHNYIIDGNIAVSEVVIDTNGNSLARFYHLEPVGQNASNTSKRIGERGKEILDELGQRSGMNPSNAVVKQYPTTTHAKTVEFRVFDQGDLNKLLSSVRNAWINGRGRVFTLKTGN